MRAAGWKIARCGVENYESADESYTQKKRRICLAVSIFIANIA